MIKGNKNRGNTTKKEIKALPVVVQKVLAGKHLIVELDSIDDSDIEKLTEVLKTIGGSFDTVENLPTEITHVDVYGNFSHLYDDHFSTIARTSFDKQINKKSVAKEVSTIKNGKLVTGLHRFMLRRAAPKTE